MRALSLWDAFLARVLALLDRDCGPVADDDEIEPDPPKLWTFRNIEADATWRTLRPADDREPYPPLSNPLTIAYADDDDQDES